MPQAVVSPYQDWVIAIAITQGGASLCPGLTCCGPFETFKKSGGQCPPYRQKDMERL